MFSNPSNQNTSYSSGNSYVQENNRVLKIELSINKECYVDRIQSLNLTDIENNTIFLYYFKSLYYIYDYVNYS